MMHLSRRAVTIVALAAGLFAQAAAAQAAEIKILASDAMEGSLDALVPQFERATGTKVAVSFAPTNIVMARIKAGEMADAVVLIKNATEALRASGKTRAAGQTDIATTSLGLAVKAGAPKPGIASVEAFKRAMLDAKSVVRSDQGASGIYFTKILDQIGIAEAMKTKTQIVKPGVRAAEPVAAGKAEIAVQMMSELVPVPGVDIVGALPGSLRFDITLTGAVFESSKQSGLAFDFLNFLKSPAAGPVYKKNGMDRV